MAKAAAIYKMTFPDAPLRDSAEVLLVRWNEMIAWSDAIADPECVTELHQMRIAAKRLRYTLELFAPVLGDEAQRVLKSVEEIQEQLGKIHDCDVLFPLIVKTVGAESEQEARRSDKRPDSLPPVLAAEGLSQLLADKRREREERYYRFLQFWHSLPPEGLGNDIRKLAESANAGISGAAG
ncbi:MAG: hypothetical protein OHK0029_32070 [Armatimonadaceae bacterium]